MSGTVTFEDKDGVIVVTLDCKHSATAVMFHDGGTGQKISRDTLTELALAKAETGTPCRCFDGLRGPK